MVSLLLWLLLLHSLQLTVVRLVHIHSRKNNAGDRACTKTCMKTPVFISF
jgi:hypothetical protein